MKDPAISSREKSGPGQFLYDTSQSPPAISRRLSRRIVFIILGLLFSTGYYFQHRRSHEDLDLPSKIGVQATSGIDLPRKLQQAWAQYSPYFPAARYTSPPENCEVVQVNLLQRHGARFPTKGASKKVEKALQKLINAGSYMCKEYEFLADFVWDLGVDALVPFGAEQSFNAGSEHYLRYRHLINEDQLPFIRAAGSERVVYSAMNWSQGFYTASEDIYSPVVSVIMSEKKGANNTLDDAMCPNAESNQKPGKAWRNKFAPPIAERINNCVPGAKFNSDDVVQLMPLCDYEVVFHEAASPFCGLFTQEEWEARGYYDDLQKYYGTGYGNSLGPVQGVGYVNELLARLTGLPVSDETQTNRTLDASPETFPLDRSFYADFSHDNEMVAIYSAMGLFRLNEPLTADGPDPTRTWQLSKMTPFSGRMITEKLWCGSEFEEYVRILVDDAVQPLEFCGADEDGLCTLTAFVESQAYARSNGEGDWERCTN